MDDNSKEEVAYRRKAIRLMLKGLRPCKILKQIPRGRTWLYKWRQWFEQRGWECLRGESRRPHQSPQAYDRPTRTVVLRVRRCLQQRPVGLIGARAIEQEIRQHRLLPQVPARTTIKRWLKQAGLLKAAPPPLATLYYPEPTAAGDLVLQAMDWTARYLTGGVKVFVFHTVDAHTHALAQTLSTDKTGASLQPHVLQVWQTLGLPHGLLLDNDAAFTGGERTPRRFGAFVRLCLYVGIELIFTPPGEPKRNGLVEGLNGLWARSFWDRDHFGSFKEVLRKSSRFTQWYTHHYSPPALDGRTPAQAQRGVQRWRLTKQQINALPQPLPLTAGRLHFIRRVAADGQISFLGETWKVGQGLAHHYVWATVITHRQRLEIHHQRSERSQMRLVKTFPYEIAEPVRRLRPEYKR